MELIFRCGSIRIGAAPFYVQWSIFRHKPLPVRRDGPPALSHPCSLPGPILLRSVPFQGESIDATHI